MNDYTNTVELEMHPIVEAFPLMSEDEFEGLKASIKANGQLEPIRTWRGMIIDGRHRYLATQELGLEPITANVDGDEAQAHLMAVSLNANRRNMTPSQRAGVGLSLFGVETPTREECGQISAAKRHGSPFPTNITPAADIAERVGVSAALIKKARRVVQRDPYALHGLISGVLTVTGSATNGTSARQFVYVIKASGNAKVMKIGVSANPDLRARQLEVTPFQSFTVAYKAEIQEAYRVEQAVHLMAELRGYERLEFSNGEQSEWFKMNIDEAVALIDTVLG